MSAGLLAIALLAGETDALDAYRRMTGAAKRCDTGGDTEITVCGRRDERYRLPDIAPVEGSRAADAADAAGERKRLAGDSAAGGGFGSCSPVGAAGMTGCTPGISLFGLGRKSAGLNKKSKGEQ